MNTKRTVFSLLIIAILFSSVAMIPMSSAKRDTKVELIGTPWSEEGDEFNRLSTDEIRELAKTNETARKLLEDDLKLDGAKIESFEDLKYLPENYSKNLTNAGINDLISVQSNQSSVDRTSIVSVYVWIVADEEYRSHFGGNRRHMIL
ncbi:hypothetical protein [Methanolobus sp.]|uniref:hypothetical protein n=1 Tax=Methanolobus sp. TaxID=1874737 RepID=UPI0025FA1B42|nr:hypothetical protein [Methanolobus sp.]